VAIRPVDVYDLAAGWFNGNANPDEPLIRSIVSRGYYGAFLLARNKALLENERQDVHLKTVQAYTGANSEVATKIAGQLDSLRVMRVTADYDLRGTLQREDAVEALELAAEIITDLNTGPNPIYSARPVANPS
jgi:hypothetical protein